MQNKHDNDKPSLGSSKNKTEPADDPNPLYLDFNFDLNYDEEFNYHQQRVLCQDANALMNVASFGVEQHQFYEYAQSTNNHHHQHQNDSSDVFGAGDPNSLEFVDFNALVNAATNDHHPDQLVFAAATNASAEPIQYYIDETNGQLVVKEQLEVQPDDPQIIVSKPKRIKKPVKRGTLAAVAATEYPNPPVDDQPIEMVERTICAAHGKRKQTHSALLELLEDDFDFSVVIACEEIVAQIASPEPARRVPPPSIAGTPFRPSKRLLEKNWKNWSRKRLLSSCEPKDDDETGKPDPERQVASSSALREPSENAGGEKHVKLECSTCKEVFRSKRTLSAHKKQCNGRKVKHSSHRHHELATHGKLCDVTNTEKNPVNTVDERGGRKRFV